MLLICHCVESVFPSGIERGRVLRVKAWWKTNIVQYRLVLDLNEKVEGRGQRGESGNVLFHTRNEAREVAGHVVDSHMRSTQRVSQFGRLRSNLLL